MTDDLEFFAEVDISSSTPRGKGVAGHRGIVIGKSQDEESNDWFYAVMVDGRAEAIVIARCDLRPTGKIVPRESIYGGDAQRVVVNPATGEGRLADG